MSINPSTTPGYTPPPPAPAYASPPPPAGQAPYAGPYAPPAAGPYAPPSYLPPPAADGTGKKIPILFGAVIALLAANAFTYYQLSNLKTDLNKTQNSLSAELDKVRENSAVTGQTQKRNVETLREQLEAARRQARSAAGEAKTDALKKVEETRVQLQAAQAAQEQALQQANTKISEVKQSADTANTKVAEVNTEVGTVKTEVASTKTELEKTVAELKRTQGDLDGHSTLIATNSKELTALRALGERNYIEFNIHKAKAPQKVGDVMVLLKKTDPKKNRYTIELTADDKTVEKKDRTINEPLQFLVSKATQPYEIIVNDVKKDQIAGYLAVPKVQTSRK